ncbi:MAG: hypothetical protein PHS59_07890 [Paludibacter sp.]|nr:hypothetical protein [Paludibacter sp.]
MKSQPTLIFCLLMDLIGSASFFIPGIGEWFDLLWAPLSAFIFYKTFGGKLGKLGSVISFVEEILPYTDIIPTFTLGYFYKHNGSL